MPYGAIFYKAKREEILCISPFSFHLILLPLKDILPTKIFDAAKEEAQAAIKQDISMNIQGYDIDGEIIKAFSYSYLPSCQYISVHPHTL